MPIEIYPNRLEERPLEVHRVEKRMTIAAFLNQTMDGGYADGEVLALSAWVNDERIELEEWPSFIFLPSDRVRLHFEPQGTDPFTITAALFAGVKAVFGMLIPKLPGTPEQPGQGDQLSQGSVRGNKVKLGDPVREVAGRMRVYPDYLLPPHKYFLNFEEQWTELGLCVGVGRFQILAGNVRIGDTQLLALGSEAEYQIFQPGANVSGYAPFQWWHTAPEVGASSTGAAGLELTVSTDLTPSPTASQFRFSGYEISIPAGQGSFPSDWSAGLIIRVVAPYTYTVTEGGSGRDEITGPLHMLDPTPGDTIEVAGFNAGVYEVFSYSAGVMTLNTQAGAPVTELAAGTGLAAIGPLGLRFRITAYSASSIAIERLDESGATDTSFPGFDTATIPQASVSLDASNYQSGWRGPFPACPENEVTDVVELDFFFPEGLCGIGDEGNQYATRVDWEVEWREVGSSAWNTITYSETRSTLNQGGFTKTHLLPAKIRPEYRCRKTYPPIELLELRNKIQWYGLRAKLDAPSSYQGVTTIGVRVRTSDRISAQTESLINVVATRILPRRSGGEGPTRSLADFADYIRASLGRPPSTMNYEELDRLEAVWAARGDTFNAEYASESTALQAFQDVFGAGFSELTLSRGQVTPVRDEPRTVFEQMYSPQNIVGYLSRTPRIAANPDEFDGVDVTYMDEATWTESTIPCRLPGDLGLKVEKITAPGITSADKAYQLGMRRRRILRYRVDSFEWATEADALVSRYLSYCAVADDVSGYPQSALMVRFTAPNRIRVSEPLDWSGPGPFGVLLRRPDGSVSGAYGATRIDDYNLQLAATPDFVPSTDWANSEDPPHVLFGQLDRLSYRVLITSVEPNGLSSARVEAVGYDDRVYLDDDSPAPK